MQVNHQKSPGTLESNTNFLGFSLIPVLLNLVVKLLVIGLVVLSFAAPDLPQFEGKLVIGRAVAYPWFVLALPALYWARGRPRPYPHVLDVFVVLPIVFDLGGNAIGIYDNVPRSDLIAHFLVSIILVLVLAAIISPYSLNILNRLALTIGFGITVHVLWEIAEFVMMKLGAFNLNLTYSNTIHDLSIGILGSVAGSILTITLLRPGPMLGGGLYRGALVEL